MPRQRGAVLDAYARMTRTTCGILEPSERITPLPAGNFQRVANLFAPPVLVVDDEPLIRWSVSESLADLGFRAEIAPDAASALRIITTARRPFEVVVLDLRLPDMHDLSLLGTIRQLLPRARLILMTAFSCPDVLVEATAIGADVLAKPFEMDELKRLVTEERRDLC